MKILLMGCGGIGSWFCHFLSFGIRNYLPRLSVTVADGDMVEEKNLLYSNFDIFDIGKNKAEVLGLRYHFNFIPKFIENREELKDFNMVIIATDDGKSRKLVFESGVDWIDLRAKGKIFAVFCKGCNKQMIGNLDFKRGRESCQDDFRLKENVVDSGNIVAAAVGYQKFLNYVRKEKIEGETIGLL